MFPAAFATGNAASLRANMKLPNANETSHICDWIAAVASTARMTFAVARHGGLPGSR